MKLKMSVIKNMTICLISGFIGTSILYLIKRNKTENYPVKIKKVRNYLTFNDFGIKPSNTALSYCFLMKSNDF